MRAVIIFFLSIIPMLGEDFISEFEYGQMLYRDPRGVSCVPCHGETGKGKYIVSYLDRHDKKIDIYGPEIRTATLDQITVAVKKGKGVMPKYLLTDKEIKTIYKYLQKVNSDNNQSNNNE